MKWLAKLLGKRDGDANLLVVIPIPPLITLLQQQEALKGAALTEAEVVGIRDRAICMTMSRSRAEQLAAQRGFSDIDPSRAWEEYVRVRPQGSE
jgi:hypothetical protein